MVESEKPATIHTNLYLGPKDPDCVNRNIDDVDGFIQSIYYKEDGENETFHSMIKRHISRVRRLGKTELTILDIGSGEGGLLNDLLFRFTSDYFRHVFLIDDPNFKINVVGLTDSPSISQQGQEKSLTVDFNNQFNESVSVKNYFYSLHRNQKLSYFLDCVNYNEIDIAFGIQSFQYFNIDVFKEVLDTIQDRLTLGGQLFCYNFHGTPPGFIPYEMGFNFNNSSAKLQSWQELVRQSGLHPYVESDFFYSLNSDELQIASKKAIALYVKLGVLAHDYSMEIMSKIDDGSINWTERSEKKAVTSIISLLLSKAARDLYAKKADEEYRKKTQILDKIDGVEFTPKGFTLTKK